MTVNDSGSAVTAFSANYTNYMMFINGMPQENGAATVTTSDLTIIGGAVLAPGDPIVLNLVVNF